MKKIVTLAAVAALATLAACSNDAAAPEAVETETVANEVELNDDGSVKTDEAANEAAPATEAGK